jgi:hypothetical protein
VLYSQLPKGAEVLFGPGQPLKADRWNRYTEDGTTVGKEVRLKMRKLTDEAPQDVQVIYRPWITLRNGKRLYATAYGLKAWRLTIRKK